MVYETMFRILYKRILSRDIEIFQRCINELMLSQATDFFGFQQKLSLKMPKIEEH